MEKLMPFFWLVLTVFLVVLEAVTVQMVAIWFAAGAVAAIIASLLGAPLWIQFIVFAVISLLSLMATRPLVQKVLKVHKTKTNADSMVGRVGIVTVDIVDDSTAGRAAVGGLDWAAVAEDGQPIGKGDKILVKSIEGVKVVVEKIV